jgi:putative ABC transport system permease protein
MFEVPFLYGSAWSTADDQDRSFVVVISRDLNDQVFHGANSVGKTLNFDNRDYRVVGVIDSWLPLPRYYDLIGNKLGKSEQAFIPMTRAIENEMDNQGTTNCAGRAEEIESWAARLTSECVWVQFWVELPTAADETRYRAFLNNYAAEQQRTGRFHWGPRTKLHDVRQWLVYMHVVSDEIRILVLVSFSFLFVCLLNAMGLMLAKIMSRAGDIGVRRALGASRAAIFQQCLIESGVVGLAGGILGIALTLLSLRGVRALVSDSVGRVSHLHMADVAIAVGLSVAAAILAGLYPTWRAAQVQPAWQLKTQ